MMFEETQSSDQNRSHRVILAKTDDAGLQQLVDYGGLNGEQHTKVLRIQSFGLSTHAPANSEGVILALANRDMPVILGLESPKHRPTSLPEGGTRLYDMNGSYVDLDAAGNIKTVSAKSVTVETKEANLKAETFNIEADVKIKGNITQEGSITSTGVHKASAHT